MQRLVAAEGAAHRRHATWWRWPLLVILLGGTTLVAAWFMEAGGV